jgi:3-hydroxymyristoyl/3-hydroxydecanoyl-(acyl carrier protein) dehydratase
MAKRSRDLQVDMEFVIPNNHPALAGHFPGHPIVPAVVILDEVLSIHGRSFPGSVATGITTAKFSASLLPDHVCQLSFQCRDNGVRFQCASNGRIIASGLLAIAR